MLGWSFYIIDIIYVASIPSSAKAGCSITRGHQECHYLAQTLIEVVAFCIYLEREVQEYDVYGCLLLQVFGSIAEFRK